MREICMSGSMRGMWKRGYGKVILAPPDERGGKQTNHTYCYRATSLLYREPVTKSLWLGYFGLQNDKPMTFSRLNKDVASRRRIPPLAA